MSHGSLSAISSYVLFSPKCGHLLTQRPGASCASARLFSPFSFFLLFFHIFFSPCTRNVNCARHKAAVQGPFEYLQVPLQSYVRPSLSHWVMCVSCSWLNVPSFLQRLLSNTGPGRQPGSAMCHNTRLWRCSGVCRQRGPVSLETAAESHTYLRESVRFNHLLVLSAISY